MLQAETYTIMDVNVVNNMKRIWNYQITGWERLHLLIRSACVISHLAWSAAYLHKSSISIRLCTEWLNAHFKHRNIHPAGRISYNIQTTFEDFDITISMLEVQNRLYTNIDDNVLQFDGRRKRWSDGIAMQ